MKFSPRSMIFWLTTLVCALAGAVPAARAVNLVQEFYLPMPEAQIYTALNSIEPGVSTSQSSIYSIIVTGNGTVIYYDQWEDGYETDLGNPTQASTQIWGDGNDAHGIPPGFAHNPLGLPAGTVITLTNSVPLPRNPSVFLFDGRDRIAATKALVVTHAGWPVSPGPVYGGAVSVLSTIDYGTNYISPVGQDLTNNLFKYVGFFVMASQNGTAVTIDPDGPGPLAATNIVLNQGESFLYNGGIKTGASVVASKPVQAHLMIGHVGSAYAADWFTLYPAQSWSSAYYTPVGSAASGSQPAYVYLYNSNPTNISINYKSLISSGSFSVPASNGVYQFQMPIGSGASFISSGGANFYALCTVAANNSSDTAYNWGFTLLPAGGLTTEADVGWAPGSSDGSVDGNPVWVTPLAATRVYVDYNGDHLGPLTDPNGNHYDTNYDLAALQSKKIYDPSKDQTAMRVYTLDGTPISAAWGEDADVALPGLPYIDAGTTVLPFPVPVLKKSSIDLTHTNGATALGDILLYNVEVDNKGLLPLGNVVVIDLGPTNLTYVTNTTTINGTPIPDNPGTNNFPLANPGYTIPVILRAGTSVFQYEAKIVFPGSILNAVNVGGTSLYAQNSVSTATNSSTIAFTTASGSPTGSYAAGTNIYVQLTDPGANTSSNSIQTLVVVVNDTNSGDFETATLIETSTNSGVFINTNGLPTSLSAGILGLDGTLHVAAGDTLTVNFTDPIYGNSCSNSAVITGPQLNKVLYLSANGTNGVQALNRVNPAATAGHGTNYTSVDLGTGGGSAGVIGVDASSFTSNGGSANPVVWSHTVGNGTNRILVVGVSTMKNKGPTVGVSSVTYSGLALTRIGIQTNSTDFLETEMWYLLAPPQGTTNIVVTLASATKFVGGAISFFGVNQTTPLGTFASAQGSSTTASVAVSSATNEVVIDTLGTRGDTLSAAAGSGQTVFWNTNSGLTDTKNAWGAGSTEAGSSSVTMSWTLGGAVPWSIGAVSIKPATNAVATNGTMTTTFTQTPSFVSPFTIASNQTISVTAYITVTNGTVIGNSNITATLQANGANFITLTNPVYNAGTYTNLVWTNKLSTNFTIPANQAISCVFSNNQPGVTFHINYDTTNQPSQISLPAVNVAGNVVHITSLGVYDAPYPGGNLVNAPVAGSKLYVRVTATDPFGTYDISSVNFAITGPSSNANVNATLTNAVNTTATNATYEYFWQAGTTTGAYNVSATANEGSEGINDVAGTSLTLVFLDLGTPSTTEFTSGNNGPATNNYNANSTVCMRVTDLNRNTNAATVDLITAILTSSAGGSNTVTLTETDTNTGVFTACINTSTNGSGGQFLAPVGSQLTLSYTDPTDSSDHTTATATIIPPPGVPGIALNKTIVSPASGLALIGNPVQFNLQVINTGSTTLTNVSLTDNFPSASLSFTNASLPPNSTNASSLVWTNIGSLTPGQSTNIFVTFNAIVAAAVTNSAVVISGLTNSAAVPFTIANPALTVTKTLLSPTNSPVSISSNVVFRIVVKNTGNTAVSTLPMEDNFSAAYLQFVSATVPPDGSGAGSLLWTNLVGTNTLAVNASITNDITMLVVGAGNPALNNATVDYAVDSNGNPVPTSSSTSTNLVTASAAINGHVYNDINQSGVFTNGDTGLSSVTLALYTDPNGDGNPADGVLLQIVATDGNGYYEFLNLTLGHYIVVQTTLPGYVTSSPVNNRLPLNITSLTTSASNNFFQYQPSPAVYGNISGTVYYDTAGNGTYSVGETGIANVEIDLVQDANTNGLADLGEPVVASTTTDTNGNYSFLNATPGDYVVRQTLLFGYYSTGDSSPPNNNQVPITLTAGLTATNNNFYDRLLPTAVNDTYFAPRNLPVILYPLVNDISPNGDALAITNAATTNGIVIINAGNTNLAYTPASLGIATITYTISDGHGGSSTAIITVNVTNIPPVAVNDTASTFVNLPVTINVLTNDSDANGDALVITNTTTTNGVVVINAGSTNLTYTPATNFSGTVTLNYTINDGNGGTASASVTVTVSPLADLAIGKSAPLTVLATSNLVYNLTVTNFGPSSATSVTVTDALPSNVIFVSATGGGVTNGGVVMWSLGTLTNSQVTNLVLTVSAPVGGSVTNVASVGPLPPDPNPTNNVTPPVITPVTPVAGLLISKAGPAGVWAAGAVVYTIVVSNAGPSSAGGVVVTDAVPVGESFVGASGLGTTNGNAGVVVWSLGTLTNGEAAVLGLTNAAPADAPVGGANLVNVAVAGSTNGMPAGSAAVVTVVTNVADVGVVNAGPAVVAAGSVYTNVITVMNLGPSVASNVVVVDVLPNGAVSNYTVVALAANGWTNIYVVAVAPGVGPVTNVASVSAGTYDPQLNNNTNASVSVVTPVAGLLISKAGPAGVWAAGAVVYTIVVSNAGPSSAGGVVVTDAVPVGESFVGASGLGTTNGNAGVVVWSLGTLTNGEAAVLGLTNAAPADAPVGGANLVNVAVAGSTNGMPAGSAAVVTVVTNVADVGVVNAGPAVVAAGSVYTNVITVMNLGPSVASNVVVVDVLPNGAVSNYTVVALAANGWTNIYVVAVAPGVGPVTNVASVSAGTYDPQLNNNTNASVSVVTPVAGLLISKAGPAGVWAAGAVVYTIVVSNAGPSSAGGVVVTDAVPVGESFVGASGLGTTNGNAGVVVWSLGTLTNGEAAVLGLTNAAPADAPVGGANLVNVAVAGSTNGMPAGSAAVVTVVTNVADVGVVNAGPAVVAAGSVYTNVITVMNLGPSVASNVVVVDVLPNGAVSNYTVVALAANGWTNIYVVAVAPGVGPVTNVASVSAGTYDPQLNNNTNASVSVVTPVAGLLISKAGPAGVWAAGAVVYTIVVSNAGPSSAGGVVVTDAVPVGESFVGASGLGTTNGNAGVVVWSLGTLTNGEAAVLGLTNAAPADAPVGGANLVNVAVAGSTNGMPAGSAAVVTVVTNVADVGVVNAGPAVVAAGSVYTNVITVMNLGPSVASNVVVVDVLPNGAVSNYTVVALAANGWTNIYVVAVAPGVGPVTNVASVSAGTYDPQLNNNTNASVSVVTPVAGLLISKAGPAGVWAAGAVVYTIVVSNAGPSSAGGVVVTDAVPVGESFVGASGLGTTNGNAGVVVWSLGTLTNGEAAVLGLTNAAPADAPVGGANLVNVAVAGSTNGMPAGSAAVVTVVTNVADVGVVNAGPAVVAAGSVYTNVITVMNLGPSVASNVVVVDVLPNGAVSNYTVVALAANGWTNIYVVAVAPGVGPVTNVASVSAGTYDPQLNNNTNASVSVVTPVAGLLISKAGPAGVWAAGAVVYTIVVSNAGPSSAGGVVVTDAVPVGESFVGASGLGTTNGNAGVVVWSLGTLTNGEAAVLGLTNAAPADAPVGGANLVNVAVAGSTNGMPAGSAAVVTVVTNVADVGVVNAGPAVVAAGSVYTNVITVMNLGPSVASNVVVVDVLPNGAVSNYTVVALAANGWTNIYVVAVAPGVGPVTNVASVSAGTYDPQLNNNTNASVSVVTPVAGLLISKAGPAGVWAAGAVVYTIVVSNAGPSSAGGVVVTDAVPVGESFVGASGLGTTNGNAGVVVWSLGTLTNGEAAVLGLTNAAPADAPVGGANLVNVAVAGSTNGMPAGSAAVVTVVTNVADVGVVNAGPAVVAAGSVYTNVITVMNLGPSVASNVVVVDVLPNGAVSNYTVVALAANGWTNIYVVAVAPGVGPVTNVASVSAGTYDPQLNNNTNASVSVVTPVAGLLISKAGPAGVWAAGAVVYTIVVSNAGPSSAGGVVVTDAVPVGESFVGASGLGTTNGNAGVVVWSLGTLTNGEAAVLGLTNAAPADAPVGGANLVNVAVAGSTNGMPAGSAAVVTVVTNVADVGLGKSGPLLVAATSNLVYTISVTNFGPSSASSVVVTDALPANVTFVTASGNGATNNAGAVIWNLGSLTKSQVTNLTLTVKAPAGGSLTNVARVYSPTFDPNPANNTNAPVITTVTNAAAAVADVQVFLFGPSTNTAGDGFSYTNVVTNAGPSTAVNTLVTNVLPANLVFVSASGGGVFSNGIVTWPVFASLTNGQVTNLILTVTNAAGVATNLPTPNPFNFIVSNSTPTVGFLTNRASAFAATFDPNLTNNIASAAYTNAQVQTLIVPGVFSVFIATNTYPTNGFQGIITNTIIPIGNNLFIVGTSAWNPVTQLYEEFVSVTNIGPWAVHSLRLYVGGLRSGVTLYNATGTNSGVPYVPYVEYDPPYSSPLNPYPASNNSVTFVLEFYAANGLPFTNSLRAVASLAPTTQPVNGVQVTNVQIHIQDNRNPATRYLIQFTSIPGRTYTITYSDDMVTWYVAVPSIVASATSTLWYDVGPPETLTEPGSSRFYKVILNP